LYNQEEHRGDLGPRALPEIDKASAGQIVKWLQREKISPCYIDKESNEHTY
jgi:hypothetical protein